MMQRATRSAWLPLALLGILLLGPGCHGRRQDRVSLGVRGHSRGPGLAEDPAELGQLHPSVVEVLLHHPALPFAFGGHGGEAPGSGHMDTSRLVPALNRVLARDVRASLYGGGPSVHLTLSRRAGLVHLWWQVEREGRSELLVDLGPVPGAFDPEAELDVQTVRSRMIAWEAAP